MEYTMPDLKRVAVLTYEGLPAYEFSCALEMFALPRPEIDNAYTCEALAVDGKTVISTGGISISVKRGVGRLDEFGTVVIPGWPIERRKIPAKLKQRLLALHAAGGRLISICSGAFLLAELGLLDGKQATTHWQYSDIFKQRFPLVNYLGDVLYTESDNLYTSAGSSAGLDLCLQIIRHDLGHNMANQVARRLVMPPHRSGGQAQYADPPISYQPSRLSDALQWGLANLSKDISVDQLADKACMSRRSFDRQFRSSMAISPKQWLIQLRIHYACELLESSELDIEQVAAESGFDKAINLRHHFKLHKGVSPSQYRSQFGERMDGSETA
jgi:AraC family transcriptional activator FtrA